MTASSAVKTSGKERTANVTLKAFGSAAILVVALIFVINYVVPLYLHYNEAAYNDGAPNHWALRGWLLMHITGGTVALLTGPWQFWTGFRRRYARLHRWMGRVFLCGVAVGSVGAYRMAMGTTFGCAGGEFSGGPGTFFDAVMIRRSKMTSQSISTATPVFLLVPFRF